MIRKRFDKNEHAKTRMRRSALRNVGKRGKLNRRANAQLAKDFKGPKYCEARYPHDCTGSEQLTWAHNKKRRKNPDLLHAALICVNAHEIAERLPAEQMESLIDGIIEARDTRLPEAA